ncbi:Mitogen-activated protein kinase-binding protein 1 [Desmophyllum pertusum]|uniref:Mitogen-activated protein kinase-binding protein 1 n=1 Tax=Desmophyllum pertusum TaxID=174260 RepID=A0A9X0CIY8_9CNID|nr:Mitogen-activated protein kinase-binding protein 1 [Desmophyllum pertusum]
MNPDRVGRIPPPTRRLVVRKANSHRDLRPITERATLEKVLGLTVSRNACLACDPLSGVIAYPAGCVVVLFNPRKNKQSFVLNTSKKNNHISSILWRWQIFGNWRKWSYAMCASLGYGRSVTCHRYQRCRRAISLVFHVWRLLLI